MKLPRIVYIAGWGRSGSTLLCRTLGELPGWLCVGEVRLVWELGVLRNSACSCGAPFGECPFWRAVFQEGFGGMDESLAHMMLQQSAKLHTWQMLAMPRARLERFVRDSMAEYVGTLERLYRAIASVSGAAVIVDSSKMPPYALALQQMTGVDLRIVHLVRDPRACSYSWARRDKQQPFGRMKTIGPVRSSLQWVQRNEAIRAVWRGSPDAYRMVRYEDFVADPGGIVSAIASMAGSPARDLGFVAGGCIRLGASHMAAGNPNRFEMGAVTLREDGAWRTGLSTGDRVAAGLVTAPWLGRYGYARADRAGEADQKLA